MANIGFNMWKRMVDDVIRRKVGLHSDDLPDCPYYDWYEQGLSPLAAARRALARLRE